MKFYNVMGLNFGLFGFFSKKLQKKPLLVKQTFFIKLFNFAKNLIVITSFFKPFLCFFEFFWLFVGHFMQKQGKTLNAKRKIILFFRKTFCSFLLCIALFWLILAFYCSLFSSGALVRFLTQLPRQNFDFCRFFLFEVFF